MLQIGGEYDGRTRHAGNSIHSGMSTGCTKLPEVRILPDMGYHGALAHHGTHRYPPPAGERPQRLWPAPGACTPAGAWRFSPSATPIRAGSSPRWSAAERKDQTIIPNGHPHLPHEPARDLGREPKPRREPKSTKRAQPPGRAREPPARWSIGPARAGSTVQRAGRTRLLPDRFCTC
jgi:hypothetical protein